MPKKTLINILGIYLFLMVVIPKSFNTIGGVIPVRLVLSIIVILNFIFYKLKNSDYKIEGKKYLVLGGLLLISFIPSLIKSVSVITSFYSVIKFALALGIFICVYNLKLDKDDLKILFRYLGLSLIVVLIYGLIQYLFDINLTTIGSYNYPGSKGRISATFFNTIYFSIFLDMIIFLLTYLVYKTNNKLRIISIILLVISYICMLLTFTRSAVLIFVCCLLVTIIFNYKVFFNKFVIITFILMISASFLIPGVKTLYCRTFGDITTLAKTSETEDPSLEHRMMFSEIGKVLGKDYFPSGIGLGSFEEYVNSYEYTSRYPEYAEFKTHPHSSLILLFAEASVWPIIVFIISLLFMAFDLIVLWYNNRKNEISNLAVLTATILGGFFIVNIIAENAIYDSQIFPIFLLVLGGLFSYINEVKLCQK